MSPSTHQALKTELIQEEGVWILRLMKEDGRIQVYRCASESQARALLLVLRGSEPPQAPTRH